jgi:isorenieratene synthase
MEKTSAEWSYKNQGGIFEFHSYAVPKDMVKDEEIKEAMLYELFHYMPELKGLEIRHEFFQHRDDFPGFHIHQFKNRPEIKTGIPGLYAAGDWVKMDNCTMLMEAAYTSGALAANYILSEEGLQENPLRSVPVKGLLA